VSVGLGVQIVGEFVGTELGAAVDGVLVTKGITVGKAVGTGILESKLDSDDAIDPFTENRAK